MVLSVLSSTLLDLQSSSLVGCFVFVKQVLNRPFDNNEKKKLQMSLKFGPCK